MALPALPAIGIGAMVSYFGLVQRDVTTGFSLLAIGLLVIVCGIIFAFVQYKTDAAKKASKKDSPSEEATPAS